MAYLDPDDWTDKLIKFLLKVYTFWVVWDNFPPKFEEKDKKKNK